MGMRYQRRTTLWRSKKAGSTSALWVNWSIGIPSISLRLGRVTWNTKRGFSSVRVGRGLTYQDRD